MFGLMHNAKYELGLVDQNLSYEIYLKRFHSLPDLQLGTNQLKKIHIPSEELFASVAFTSVIKSAPITKQ